MCKPWSKAGHVCWGADYRYTNRKKTDGACLEWCEQQVIGNALSKGGEGAVGCCEFRALTTKKGQFCTLRVNNDEQVLNQRDPQRQTSIAEDGEGTHVRRRKVRARTDTKSTMCFGSGGTLAVGANLCDTKTKQCPDATYVEKWPKSDGTCAMADCPEATPLEVCPKGCPKGFTKGAKRVVDQSHMSKNNAKNQVKAVVCETAAGKCVKPKKNGLCKGAATLCMPVSDVQVCPRGCQGGYGTSKAGTARKTDEMLCANPGAKKTQKGQPFECYKPHFKTKACNLGRIPCRCQGNGVQDECNGPPTDAPTDAPTEAPTDAPTEEK